MLLKKFEDCLFVHGFTNSLIVDLGRSFFLEVDKLALKEIESRIDQSYSQGNRFIDFLIESEVLFLISEESSKNFVSMSRYWSEPSYIENSIVKCSPHLYDNVFDVLENLLCYNVTIYVGNKDLIDLANFFVFLKKNIHNRIFHNINLYLEEKYLPEMKKVVCQFMNETPNVQQLYFIKNKKAFEICKSSIDYRKAVATNSSIIPFRNKVYFNPSIYFYLDSLNYNTNYNKKLFIREDGELKNSEYDDEIYGNISDLSINEVKAIVESRSFQKKWKINKDKIEICKVCEYRYICEDFTPIFMGSGRSWHRSEKCDYDPYLGLWGSSKKIEKFNQKS
jgi:SPASM domain peptide maturase of grasp-with-spasm system